ncbi:MAG: DUF2845 domain-containing protein [Gammaproteobacteria bacterium]|nr:DUF2845 domain-containing protein [Gammaproteobacteria bacterium]MCF6261655.1 DUF2845 domain-containing protein [Gammaproteobacteria bacterium]
MEWLDAYTIKFYDKYFNLLDKMMTLSRPIYFRCQVNSIQLAVVLLILAVLYSTSSVADSMRCGNRLVTTNDSKAEVLIRCGTPDWRDQWSEKFIEDFAGLHERRISMEREQWIYNFGPQKFLRFLVFENGRLKTISTGSHGYRKDSRLSAHCDTYILDTGLSQYEVLQRCGEPFFKDSRTEEVFSSISGGSRRLVERRIDEWTYNLGPTRFMRILTFNNGRLEEIVSGSKGF